MAKNRVMGKMVWTLVLLLLVGGAGYGAWYFWLRTDSTPRYQTATITRGELTQAVTATGQLNPVLNVQVGCQISGMIAKLFVDYNSVVKEGQIVAKLDPATYEATVHQAEGDLANAKATLELAQVQAARQKGLRAKDLVPQADLDTALATLHQAEASVKLKEASLERAKVDLARCTIFSPVDGIVISRNVDVGQTVAASLNAPVLFVIANDLAKMQIDANVAEADVGNVEVGQDVNFTVDAYPYRTFRGKVTQIRNSPITVQNVVSYDTVIGVNNGDLKLRPGMTANVSIIVAQRDGVLKLPNAALRFRLLSATDTPQKNGGPPTSTASGGDGGKPRGAGGSGRRKGERTMTRTVYTLPAGVTDDMPQPAQIKIGISDGVSTEVLEGLKEGDNVVTAQVSQRGPASAPSPFGGGMRRF
ncbi:MAG: efflux RND transporter periplasmic adaptor subunit [Verrucomicrobia bacterium]|nr:efflux RND transporter periplasmic adaptor subunit [Verrucomicrobiota bacterium]